MKTFQSFFEHKKDAELFWECAGILNECNMNPVDFVVGMLEGWTETLEKGETRNIFLEAVIYYDTEILLENPFTQQQPQAKHPLPGAQRLSQWLSNKYGEFVPSMDANKTDATVAKLFDELNTIMKQMGMSDKFMNALNNLNRYYNKYKSTGEPQSQGQQSTQRQPQQSPATSDQQAVAARDTGSSVAQGQQPREFDRIGMLQSDINKIKSELSQAQAANDTRAVHDLTQKLQQYQSRLQAQASQSVEQDPYANMH